MSQAIIKAATSVPPNRAPSSTTADATPAPAPTPVNSEAQSIASWSCAPIQRLGTDGKLLNATDAPLNVGGRLLLTCEGSPASLIKESLRFVLPEEQKYQLRLLETKSLTETKAEIIVTSWTAGEVKVEKLAITDGVSTVSLNPAIELQVASVVTPENNPEQKPFPPWSPAEFSWPWSLWIVIGALCLAAIGALVMAIRQGYLRKRLLAELEKHATPLSPYNQFNKDLRGLARQLPQSTDAHWEADHAATYFAELNQSFRWYLARELVMPAFSLKPSGIARELRRLEPELAKSVDRDLVLALTELEKAINAKGQVSPEDAQQISELCRKLAESITKARSA